MNQLPDFWRTEVWHPLSVHFPIALLIIALLFKVLDITTKGKSWSKASFLMLLLGTAGAWVAVYTGNLADGIVSRKICDPTVLKAHENAAYTLVWLFSGALIINIVQLAGILNRYARLLKLVAIALMLIGSGFLMYTGHLGATLVYQQGAGVYHPSDDCGEFDE